MAARSGDSARRRVFSRQGRIVIAVAAIVILLVAAWALYRWYAERDAAAETSATAEVTAEQLARAYDQDAVGADIRYGNRTLRVSGRVHSVSAGADGPVIVLGGEDPVLTVTASFDRAQADAVAAGTLDGQATLVCTRATLVVDSAALENCRFAQ